MKRFDVKLVAQRLLRPRPQFQNLQLPHLVRQRLARPSNIPVYFGLNGRLVNRRVFVEIVHHLLSRPVLRMHARIHHQPYPAPHIRFQPPVIRVGILIEPRILAQVFRVQRPSLNKCRVLVELSEARHVRLLVRNRQLKMMPRNPFVIRDRFHRVQIPVRRVVGIDPQPPRPAPIG